MARDVAAFFDELMAPDQQGQAAAIRFAEHLTGDGLTVFEHVCRTGLEVIVSKRTDAPYRSGPFSVWFPWRGLTQIKLSGWFIAPP